MATLRTVRLSDTGVAAWGEDLARDIARFPQTCLRADRLSALRQWDLSEEDAIANELRGGLEVIASGETLSGATRFASGMGRHGAFGGDGG